MDQDQSVPFESPRQKRVPSVFILVAISMVAPAGINIIAPSLSAFVDVFDTDYGRVQLALSLFLVAIAFSQLVLGPLSDFFGRRPIILIGMLISMVGSVICIFSPTIEIFITGRILQGMGACTGIALARTIIRDLYTRDKAASMIGYVTMAMTVSPMAVPYIGGLLQENVAWWGSSLFMLVLAAVVFVGAFINLHETNPYLGKKTSIRQLSGNYNSLLREKRFIAFAITCGFSSAAYFAFMGGAPLLSDKVLGLTPTGYGLYFIMIAAGYGFGNFLSGRFAQRQGIVRMIMTGCFINICGILLVAALFSAGYVHPASLFVPCFISSIANGLTLPSTIAGAVSIKPEIAGTASGAIGFTQIGFGAIAATLTAEWLNIHLSIWPMVIVMIGSGVLALLCGLWVKKLERIENHTVAPIAPAAKP
ncbi:MAG: multidrug effflux MFS transporter [Hyphomicrobiales bacterium]